MADNTVGRLNVEITGNAAPLQSELGKAEAATRDTAAKMNESFAAVGRGGTFDSIGKGIKDSTAGLRNLLSSVVAVVGAFSRMAGLIGLATAGAVALGAAFKSVWESLAKIGTEAEVAGYKVADPLIRQLDRLKNIRPATLINVAQLEEDFKKFKEIDERIAKLQAEQAAQRENPYGGGLPVERELNGLLEERKKILQEISRVNTEIQESERKAAEEKAAKEMEALEDKAQQDILAAMRKASEQRRAERKKEIDELAEYQLESAIRLLKKQKEMDKERIDAQIKNFRALESAFESLVRTQRGAFDSNKLAIDINRLAAAVEDIARSPRGGVTVYGQGF